MNLSPLVPLFVSFGLVTVKLIGRYSHHRVNGDVEIYRYPPVYAYVMVFGCVFFLAAPFFPGARGSEDLWSFFFFFASFSVSAFLAAVYLLRYRVRLGKERLSYGAFFIRTIDLAEIIDAEVRGRGNTLRLFVKLCTGRKMVFEGSLSDFGLFARHMASCALQNTGRPIDDMTIKQILRRAK
jgi:hypothetical protein